MLRSLFRNPPAPAPAPSQACAVPGAANFIQAYGHLSLSELLAEWQEVDLGAEHAGWLCLPPRDFLDFCRSYPPTPFDAIPSSTEHLRPPSFLISQAHRVWTTTSLANGRLKELGAREVLDLGSFPFVAPLVLRDYFGYTGAITATTNLPLPQDHVEFLARKNIRVELLDLDPFVRDPDAGSALPRTLPHADGSFDFILSSHVIEHLYHPKTMVGECARLLREGGEFVVTTDNAMMLDVFLNFVSGCGYTFEPVEQTAAMFFNFWRGHVRFFTDTDLRKIMQSCGLVPVRTEYFQCFYDVFFDDYFKRPVPRAQKFKARMYAESPWLRNEIVVIGKKPSAAPA